MFVQDIVYCVVGWLVDPFPDVGVHVMCWRHILSCWRRVRSYWCLVRELVEALCEHHQAQGRHVTTGTHGVHHKAAQAVVTHSASGHQWHHASHGSAAAPE